MENTWNVFSRLSLFLVPVLFMADIVITLVVKKRFKEINSWYYGIQRNMSTALATILKALFALMAIWCLSSTNIGIGRTSNAFIPLVYMATVVVYTRDFLRHLWRVKHGLDPVSGKLVATAVGDDPLSADGVGKGTGK